jgi:hypothetical protein
MSWYNEPRRHALSAKGVKTARDKPFANKRIYDYATIDGETYRYRISDLNMFQERYNLGFEDAREQAINKEITNPEDTRSQARA